MGPILARRVGALVLALGLLGSVAVAPALAASIVVNSLADSVADDGVCTLRETIMAANNDLASGVTPGECGAGSGTDAITFAVAGPITLASALPAITTDLSIAGAGFITISGASTYQVFAINAGTVTLSGLTITGGAAANGAGIFNNAGTLTVTNSTISGNTASANGGGIFNNATLTVTNSTISGNAAGQFGGGIVTSGTLTVTNSTISGNAANFSGGGIGNDGGTVTVTDSTISGNTAPDGGGMFNFFGTLTVTNSTISGNTADDFGGGMFNNFGTLTVTNSTISGNGASGNGGGIRADGTETLVNAIVAGNTAPTDPDINGVAETITTSVIGVPGGKTLADILVPAGLANNGGPTQTIALALVAGNPAIDTGTGATCAAAPVNALDQRGLSRPAACDIGAYEAQTPTVAPQPNASVEATSAAGAVVNYSLPAGTDEQGGVLGVACLPASGSTFPVGSTTVTCTATDAVGHTGTRTFQVNMSPFVPLPDAAVAQPADDVTGLLYLLGALALLGLIAVRSPVGARRRRG